MVNKSKVAITIGERDRTYEKKPYPNMTEV